MNGANKITKLVLSLLMTISCINFSTVQAEDSEPAATAIPAEEVIAEPTPTTEGSAEEVLPTVSPAAEATAVPELVEDKNSDPVPTAAAGTEGEGTVVPTEEPGVEQQEAPVEPEIEKVETVEEVKVTVVVSYVDENDHPLIDPITGSYPTEYRLDENVDAFKSFDGYAFEKVIVNDDAKNTISKDDAQKNGLRITKDMTSLKLIYQKMNLESNENKEVIPEVTEEASEEAEPESNTNEKELSAFDQTAFAGNVTVHVTAAEGVLPSGAQLIVKRVTRKAILNAVEETVTEKDKEVDSAIALDITIVNADGIEIQPNGIVNVSFENVAVGGEEVNIYHVTDDASTVTEVAANTQSFDANHFSIYVITGEKKVELTTFNFVANEQNVSTQIVKTGDTLITPTAPDIAGKAFLEWQENGSKFDGFGVQTITKTETRTITAKYEDALYVYFYNPEGTQIMRTEKVADHKGHDYSNVSYDVDATHKLVGWAAEVNGTKDIAKNITVPEGSTSVNVYAIIKEGYWVSFDSDGGSAIDSQFVFDKISLNDQTTPTRPGYKFDGWYDGITKVDNGAAVSSPMTLKAHWKAKEVSYTVIHWWENADDDGYSFHESQELQGLTGESTAALAKSYTTSGKNIRGESAEDKVFTATSISQKTIKGDESTIVNVYYKRKTYTMHFKDSYYPYSELATITKKWGQSISKDEWPTYDENGLWRISDSRYLSYTSTMPMKDSTLWSTGGKYTYTAYYYVQKIIGNGYDLHHTDVIKGSGRLTIGQEDCYAISGFKFEYCNPRVGGSYNGAKFYYTRNSYKIKFINNGKEDKSVEKKYEQSISGENYTPTKPSSLPEYYVFDGWYENELCEGEAYNFTGKKMPAQNVTLYAKWTAKKINLTYNLNNPEGTVDKDNKKVEAGTVASTVLPSIPTINEYSFAGWYYADGNGNITSEVFNTNNTITRDTSIVGKWLYKGELRVVYKPGTETGATVPTDDKVYAGGARVTVAGNATTTRNMKFLGWKLNGNVYKPGQSFEVNKDIANKDNQIILTATWGDAETSTTLTYNPGNGIGTATTVNVMNNEAVEIEAHGSLGFTAPVEEGKEYYFAGWADSSTGNATYADGQTINIDANGENVLYAVWVEKAKITVVAKSDEVTYDGNNHVVDGFNSLTIDGYTVSGLSASVNGTDAGTYNNVITGEATVTKDGKDVTDCVVVTKQNGTLTIKKRQVILTSEGGSKTYDGTPLTKPNVTGGDGFVNGEVKDIKATGSVTNVSDGEVTNTITYTPNSAFKEGNYSITKNEGKLYITAKSIIPDPEEENDMACSTPSDVVYSGNEQRQPVTVTDKNVVLGTEDYDITYSEDVTNVGEVTITVTGKGNYTGEFTRTYQITPATLTVTTPDKDKVYDGQPLTAEGTITGFVNNETATFTTTGSQTEVGSSDNTYAIVWDETAKVGNYVIDPTVGTLTVTEQSIDPEIPGYKGVEIDRPENKVYTGLEQKWSPTVTDKDGNALVNDVDYEASYDTDDFTNVTGTITITITGKGNYTGSVTRTYEITPATLTVTTPDKDKVYDGTPLTAEGTITGFVNEETATFTTTGSQTEVGHSENTYSIEWNGTAKETNYTVSEVLGTLTVKENEEEIIVTTTGGTFTYDGNPHGATVTVSTLPKGYTLETATSSATATDVTDKDITAKCDTLVIKNAAGEDVTDKLKITKVPGTIKITPAPLSITTDSDTKVYDGKPLTADGRIEGLVNNEEVTFTVTGSQTTVGTSDNTYTLVFDKTAKEGNYSIDDDIGKLTVREQSIDPEDPDYSGISIDEPIDVTYDGEEHKWSPTVTDKENTALVENVDYTVSYNTENFIDVQTIVVTIKGTGNYSGTVTRTYRITPATVTVTANDDSKVFGEADPDFTATVTGLVVKDEGFVTIDYTIDRDGGEDVGKYTITPMGAMTQGNYIVEYATGTFEITPRSIKPDTPETPEEEKTGIKVNNASDSIYNGEEHKFIPEITNKDGITLVDGKDYEVSYSTDDFTNVTGEIVVTIKGKGNYTGEFTDSYQITERYVRLSSADASRPYDGTPLTRPTVTVTGDGFVEGEVEDIEATGTITNVGFVENTITYTRLDKFKESNYNITEKPGTLTITAKDVTVTANNANKVYGENDPKLEATVTGTLNNDTVDYTVTREPGEDVGTYVINVTGDEDQGNYYVTYRAGEFEITKSGELRLTAELTGESATKVYDGNPLTGGATANVKEGTTITYSTDDGTTWATEVPSITNVGTLNITARAENPNYEPAETTYSLTVTHATATVTAEDKTKTYGEADPEFTAKVEGIIGTEKDTVQIAYNTPLTRDPGEAKGTYTIHVDGEEYQGNYHVEYVAGTLEITQKSLEDEDNGIEVTNPDDTIYDGTSQKLKPTVVDTKTNATLTEGTDYYLDYSADTTNVGTVAIMIKGTGNYSGSKAASYKITPRTVKLASEDATKPYDGTPLTRPAVTVTGDGFVEGEVADITATGTITNVGSVENTITYTRLDKFKESNYNITEDTGTLTVTQQTIDPEEPDPEKEYLGVTVDTPSDVTYDGNEHKWTPTVLDADEKALTEGTDYTVSYDTEDFTNVHTITVTIEGIGNYTGTVVRTYAITPAEVTVTANNTGKVYGEADPELTAKVEGTIGNDKVIFKLERDPGEDVGTYVINVTGDEDQGNYRVTYTAGEFEITPKSIIPVTPEEPGKDANITVETPEDVKYNGESQQQKPVIKDDKGNVLEEGKDYTLEFSEDTTNAGTVTVTVTGINNYEGIFDVHYNILPRDITMTSGNAEKVYDGTALTNGEIVITGDGFVEGEGVTYNVTGTQTEAGSSANTFDYAFNENTLASNYKVTTVNGTLTVTPQQVVPVTPPQPPVNPGPEVTPQDTPTTAEVQTPTTTITEQKTPQTAPKKTETIKNDPTPEAAGKAYWALINLICAAVTVVLAIFALLSKHKKEEDAKEDEDTDAQTVMSTEEDEEDPEISKRHRIWKVVGAVDAIVAVIVFFLTENMSLPMALTDKWTVLMVVFALISVVTTVFAKKWHKKDDDNAENNEEQNTLQNA